MLIISQANSAKLYHVPVYRNPMLTWVDNQKRFATINSIDGFGITTKTISGVVVEWYTRES